MNTFDEKTPCAACGWDDEGNYSLINVKFVSKVVVIPGGEDIDNSYILRKCNRCGYTWQELPGYLVGE